MEIDLKDGEVVELEAKKMCVALYTPGPWLLGGAGLRVSEVSALKVEHIDGSGGYLHLVDGKAGKKRTSILPTPALEALETHLNGREDGDMSSQVEIVAIYPLGRSSVS